MAKKRKRKHYKKRNLRAKQTISPTTAPPRPRITIKQRMEQLHRLQPIMQRVAKIAQCERVQQSLCKNLQAKKENLQ